MALHSCMFPTIILLEKSLHQCHLYSHVLCCINEILVFFNGLKHDPCFLKSYATCHKIDFLIGLLKPHVDN